ncbi:hypothetical protein EON80_04850 [bacterium]|nr:MAG: hypothetical protein EON80_04850 [bacterium]
MKHPLPTQKTPVRGEDQRPENETFTADPTPLRGEVFDALAPNSGMKFLGIDRKKMVSGLIIGLPLLLCLIPTGRWLASQSKKPEPIGPIRSDSSGQAAIKVQIDGQVVQPGVYDLPAGARVQDALQKAGGALPGADLSGLNLAERALDGSKIAVPAQSGGFPQPAPVATTAPPSPVIPTSAPPVSALVPPLVPPLAPSSSPQVNPPAASSTSGDSESESGKTSDVYLTHLRQHPVNINIASASDLQTLPGVGPKMADRILAYRQQSGGFRSVQELDNIEGIGEKRMAQLRDFVVIQ